MKIYIAASWKHQHAVEMLTSILRAEGHEVASFVENNSGEFDKGIPFEDWMKTEDAERSFVFDTEAATESDAVVYIGPSGKDAAAECGMAYAKGVPIIGLYGKGEDFGLMRKMMSCWVSNYRDILTKLDQLSK